MAATTSPVHSWCTFTASWYAMLQAITFSCASTSSCCNSPKSSLACTNSVARWARTVWAVAICISFSSRVMVRADKAYSNSTVSEYKSSKDLSADALELWSKPASSTVDSWATGTIDSSISCSGTLIYIIYSRSVLQKFNTYVVSPKWGSKRSWGIKSLFFQMLRRVAFPLVDNSLNRLKSLSLLDRRISLSSTLQRCCS